jgi:hypothetical protein
VTGDMEPAATGHPSFGGVPAAAWPIDTADTSEPPWTLPCSGRRTSARAEVRPPSHGRQTGGVDGSFRRSFSCFLRRIANEI